MDSHGMLARYRAQLRLAARTTVASLAAFALCRVMGLTQSYPAVLTAVIVMQSSVGASLKVMVDRLLGSLVGAAWGVAVLFVFPPSSSVRVGIALTVALAPLALLAALKPAYRMAPVTAIILLLIPSSAAGPIATAVQRVLEIGLGGIVAMGVALLIFPARAQEALAEAAGRAVTRMGDLAAIVMRGLSGRGDPETMQSLHEDIRKALGDAETAGDEALRERAIYLASGPDPRPLCRTLRRLRSDLVTIGRATAEPLASQLGAFLPEAASRAAAAVAVFLKANGEAIPNRRAAPSLQGVESALAGFASEVANVRRDGLTRELSDEMAGRVFGLAFAVEQLHRNLVDLADRTGELARPSGA